MREIKKWAGIFIGIMLATLLLPWLATEVGAEVTVKRSADVIFAIDTTGSMGSAVANVRKNLIDFFSKVEEDTEESGKIDLRVRLISFRDLSVDGDESMVVYPKDGGWYTKETISAAKEQLEKDSFRVSGGGDGPESALLPLADILKNKDTYFINSGKKTLSQFCFLITDADYKAEHTSWKGYGDSAYTEDSIASGLKAAKIHTSVISRNSYSTLYDKFITPNTSLSSKDGGIFADIYGDYDILFEKMSELIKNKVDDDEKAISSGKRGIKPIKIAANMIVLRKEEGCKYQIAASGDALKLSGMSPVWSEKQDSAVFKGLTPSSIYAFQVYASNGALIDTYELETESSTGARFKSIPRVVYEGEVYNIKADADINHMMATSGSSIEWICNSDCVEITPDKVGNGCRMSVKDCEYNNNKRLKVSLIANVTYSVKKAKGEMVSKTKKVKKNFEIENTVDAMDIGTFLGTSENVYKDGTIVLGTTDKVELDVILNQGEMADTPSLQNMTYFISDQWGTKNNNGKKIAKVSKNKIQGVGAGITYVTIAPKHTYNPYGNCYDFSATLRVVCQPVISVTFDAIKLKAEDPNILNYKKDPMSDSEDDCVVLAKVKDSIKLKEYLKYNPENAFNQDSMKQTWVSSDPQVATVSKDGVVKCKGPGYAEITVTPVGGLEISAATGRRDVNAKPCSTTIRVKVEEITEE